MAAKINATYRLTLEEVSGSSDKIGIGDSTNSDYGVTPNVKKEGLNRVWEFISPAGTDVETVATEIDAALLGTLSSIAKANDTA